MLFRHWSDITSSEKPLLRFRQFSNECVYCFGIRNEISQKLIGGVENIIIKVVEPRWF